MRDEPTILAILSLHRKAIAVAVVGLLATAAQAAPLAAIGLHPMHVAAVGASLAIFAALQVKNRIDGFDVVDLAEALVSAAKAAVKEEEVIPPPPKAVSAVMFRTPPRSRWGA